MIGFIATNNFPRGDSI